MSANQPIQLGRRIVVWGATGSGKTTLARHLGETFGLGVIELDTIRHAGGWNSTAIEEMRPILIQRLGSLPAGWVTDGSYSQISDVYLSRADTLIWLHLPWRVSFWRLFKRTISRALTREPHFEGGPRESWRLIFLSRDSILWWSIHHHRAGVRDTRTRIAALPPSVRIYELRSSKEVAVFLGVLSVKTGTQTPHRSAHSGE